MLPDVIKDGEVIDRPGLYMMSSAWYHDACTEDYGVSSTGLRTLLNCPIKYWEQSVYNPDRSMPAIKREFEFGKAAHSALVEGRDINEYGNEYAISPYDDFRPKVAREWRDEQLALGRTVLKQSDIETLKGMLKALRDYSLVKSGGLRGLVECSIVWRDKVTGLWVKSRPDLIPFDDALTDYKTTQDASFEKFARSIKNYRYDIQLAMGVEGVSVVTKKAVQNATFLIQEPKPPFVCAHYELSDHYLATGLQMFRHGLDIARRCFDDNDWPGYPEDHSVVHAPADLVKRAFGNEKADLSILETVKEHTQ